MPSSAEGQVVSEQGVVCGAHLPEEAPPFGRGVSLRGGRERLSAFHTHVFGQAIYPDRSALPKAQETESYQPVTFPVRRTR